MNRAHDVQLDLFGEVLTAERDRVRAEQQHRVDALTCLRDSVPTTLEVVADLSYGPTPDSHGSSRGGGWAYCVSRAGLRFERVTKQWRGFGTWPRHLLTWDELAELVGDDPRRAEVAAWVQSLPMPRWKLTMRPHELWPDPARWHVSYLCNDHVHREWTRRRQAWQLVLELLNDAIERTRR